MSDIDETAERLNAIVRACRNDPNAERLVVMRQNPADNHHWSKSCGAITLDDLKIAATAVGALATAIAALKPQMQGE